MKLTQKHQAIKRKNSNICHITEYPLNDKHLDFAIAKINGRYPDQGQATNKECKEVVYVQQGQGKVVVEGKEYQLNEGDVVIIDSNEKFFWEGNMSLFISCTPAFTIEQHQLVE